ncbi:MAG: M50 family metallopeptidase [Bacteroidetes bacterium]|nr:M50 family metallopeptidase [Bacteroidota bacterium]
MKFLFSLLSLIIIPGAAIACWTGFSLILASQSLWVPLGIGMGAGVVLYFLVLRETHWFTTFDHELTHALMALIFLRRIKRFVVTGRHGGFIVQSGSFGGKFGDLMITTAPYFLPTFTLVAVFFRPVTEQKYLFYFDIFLGITMMYHLLSTAKETKENWSNRYFKDAEGDTGKTDIGKTGYIASFLSIVAFTFLFYGLIFYLICYGYPGIWPFFKFMAISSFGVIKPFTVYLAGLVKPVLDRIF